MLLEGTTIQNFLIFKKAKIDLRGKGICFITGDNRDSNTSDNNYSGKSSLFEGIYWCCFGKTIRGLTGDNIVNSKAGKNCYVSVNISDEGTKYLIERYRLHRKHENRIILWKDGKDIPVKDNFDAQEKINEIMGMDWRTFTNSVMYGKSIKKLFASMGNTDQNEIIKRIMDLYIFDAMQEVAKIRMDAHSLNISTKNVEQAGLIEQKMKAKNTLEQLTKERAFIRKSAAVEIANKEKLISDRKSSYKLDAQALDSIKKLIKRYKTTIKERLKRFGEEPRDYIAKLQANLSTCQQGMAAYKEDIKRARSMVVETMKEIVSFKEQENKRCSYCGQRIPKSAIEKHVKVSQKIIKAHKKNIKRYQSYFDNDKKVFDKTNKKMDRVARFKIKLDKMREKLENQEAKVESIKGRMKLCKQELKTLKAELKNLKSKTESHDWMIKHNKGIVEQCIKKIRKLKVQKKKHLTMVHTDSFWKTGYGNSGIRSFLLDDIIPDVSSKANDYVQILSDKNISLHMTSQKKIKSGELRNKIGIRTPNTAGHSIFEASSESEQKIINLSIMFGLQDLIASRRNKKVEQMFADEIFDTFDEASTEALMGVLRGMKKDSIFIITHSDELKQYGDNFIHIIREGGISRAYQKDRKRR